MRAGYGRRTDNYPKATSGRKLIKVSAKNLKGEYMEKKLTGSGAKAYQRDDTSSRIKPYSDWHRTLDKRLYMADVDFIEWRYRNNELVAVGVMEVTRVDMGIEVNQGYLEKIVQRYEKRDLQGMVARKVAEGMKTKAYIVLFREDCSEFWVYNLTDRRGWGHCDPKKMEDFLLQLK
jgi:hypothetical protein